MDNDGVEDSNDEDTSSPDEQEDSISVTHDDTQDGQNSPSLDADQCELTVKSTSQATEEQSLMREAEEQISYQTSPGREPPPQAKKQREQQREQQQAPKQMNNQKKHNEKNNFSEQAIRKLKEKKKKDKEPPPPNNGPRSPSIKSQIIVPRLTPEPKKNEDHNDIFKYKQKFDGKKGKIPNKVNHKQKQAKGHTQEVIEPHNKGQMENAKYKNKDQMPNQAKRPANAVAKPVANVQKKDK